MHFYPNLKNLFVQWDVVDPITACCLPSQIGQTNKGWSHISATATATLLCQDYEKSSQSGRDISFPIKSIRGLKTKNKVHNNRVTKPLLHYYM